MAGTPAAISLVEVIDPGLVGSISLGKVPRTQKMLKGHLPRVIYHPVYWNTKRDVAQRPHAL